MLAQIVTENGQKKIKALTADVGVGNPVGTIIVVCSNQIPSNYLPLGTQFDTSLYPVLYALLGTDTTPTASALGLPILTSGQYAIKATSGISENAQDNVINTLNEQRSYSTDETLTGKTWIDGKPIYRQVFTGTASNIDQAENIATISNVSSVVSVRNLQKASNAGWYENWGYARTQSSEIESTAYFDIDTGKLYQSHKNSVFNSQPYTVILEYTKTTD